MFPSVPLDDHEVSHHSDDQSGSPWSDFGRPKVYVVAHGRIVLLDLCVLSDRGGVGVLAKLFFEAAGSYRQCSDLSLELLDSFVFLRCVVVSHGRRRDVGWLRRAGSLFLFFSFTPMLDSCDAVPKTINL